MCFRLAFQNVKRSIKDYLIYIMTLTACISLFYAFLSITSRYYRPDIGAVCQSVYDKGSAKRIRSAEYHGNGAIILFVICFTILSLHQLSDSGKYRYRFQVLRNMGVEGNHIRRLILKQLGIWFGVPVLVALLISSAFILFLFIGFSIQIKTYIGAWKLLQQVGTILIILFALLICYFTSTWILFRKSISQG